VGLIQPESAAADFTELIGRLGSRPVEIAPLTQLRTGDHERGCYRVQLADGRVFKYRRMPSARRAESVERLTRLIDSPHIPRVIDRCGTGLLIEFVDAQTLRRDDITPEFLNKTASLQGRIHQTKVGDLLGEETATSVNYARRLRSSIDRLVSLQALTAKEGSDLSALALSHAPGSGGRGLTHNDYCSQNILLTATGSFFVVDNETVAIGPYNFDLARTWYLWPMKPSQRAAYWAGYSRHRDTDDFLSSFFFWIVYVMARSALFRLRGASATAAVPLGKLRGLLTVPHTNSSEPHIRM
jgi:aminoglycoside phosphotransferase (APT) family kinase protein